MTTNQMAILVNVLWLSLKCTNIYNYIVHMTFNHSFNLQNYFQIDFNQKIVSFPVKLLWWQLKQFFFMVKGIVIKLWQIQQGLIGWKLHYQGPYWFMNKSFIIFSKQNKTIATLRIDPPVAVIFNQSHIRCSQIFEAIPEDFIIILGHDLFRNIFWKINIYPFKLTYDIIITFYLYVGYKTIKYNIILDASVYPIDIHCLNNENIYTFCFSFWNGQQISRPFSDFYPFFWVNTIFLWYAGQCFWLYFCFVRTNFSVFFDSAFHVTLTFFV